MSTQGGGYGKVGIKVPSGAWKFWSTHRLVREVFDGEVNELDTLHLCSNKLCLNVDHTYSGNDAENARDRTLFGETRNVGDTHVHAKLSTLKVAEIRERYSASGESYRLLAKEFGVVKSTIRQAVIGKTW